MNENAKIYGLTPSTAGSYVYDGIGNLQALTYGNGATGQFQYDGLNRLTNAVWKTNAATIASFYYQLGLSGNRTNLSETVNGATRTCAWAYDSLYRLKQETITGGTTGTVSYGFDAVGNRTNRTVGGLSLTNQSFTFNTNDWLNGDSYDSNGNTIASSTNTFQYDALNHATNVNSGTVLLVYDGDGNRVAKTAGGFTTYYLLDDRNPSGYVQVLEEYQSHNFQTPALQNVYTYGLSLVSQQNQQDTGSIYFITDGHGSTRLLTDNGGNVVNAFTFDAYGNLIASNTTAQTLYLYGCQQWDPDLGLYYNRARYLNPGTGRFWTLDTYQGFKQVPASLHKYLYGADNPVNQIDPSGHDFELPSTLGAISIAVTLAVIDVSAISQVSVNYQKYFGLSQQDRAIAIQHNNQTMASLQRIIDSNGDRTFQDENLGVGGTLGATLPGNGSFQRAANIFEETRNLEGWPTAIEEWFARLSTDAFNPVPIEGSIAGTPEKRVILAGALLDRQRAFDRWLQRNY